MENTLPYLHGRTWTAISREERFFCAELYFMLSRMPDLKPVVRWMNEQCPDLQLSVEGSWSVGYEVCFYRDHIHAFHFNGSNSIRDKVVPETDRPFMFKRTFDLVLFHAEHLVIIEAKAQQGLSVGQIAHFERDKEDLNWLLGTLAPKVHLVLLCSQSYSKKTRAGELRERFDGTVTWKGFSEMATTWGGDRQTQEALERADSMMV